MKQLKTIINCDRIRFRTLSQSSRADFWPEANNEEVLRLEVDSQTVRKKIEILIELLGNWTCLPKKGFGLLSRSMKPTTLYTEIATTPAESMAIFINLMPATC